MIRIGVIGYGGRMQGVVELMQQLNAETQVVAVTDVRNNELRDQLRSKGQDVEAISFYEDPDEMLDSQELDAVMIGTRCSLHTTMAVKALKIDLPIYLEKPVATNIVDLMKLRDAAKKSKSKVVVSFPLRVTPLVAMAKEIIDSGKIGTIEQVQSWNDVPYGWHYYQTWYRNESETNGLFLQKATHDFDYINYLIGIRPTLICAIKSKQIYKGNRPAGLKCEDCKEWDNCLESPYHAYYTKQEASKIMPNGLLCGFAEDTGNEDSGSAIVQYETGMHVSYSQNFFARKSAGRRGARLYGYKGTIEFDWYVDEVKVHMHHVPRVETYKMSTSGASHGGGDTVLVDNFVRVAKGEVESVSPLSAGILSALMCLKAKESSETRTFQEIRFPDE